MGKTRARRKDGEWDSSQRESLRVYRRAHGFASNETAKSTAGHLPLSRKPQTRLKGTSRLFQGVKTKHEAPTQHTTNHTRIAHVSIRGRGNSLERITFGSTIAAFVFASCKV